MMKRGLLVFVGLIGLLLLALPVTAQNGDYDSYAGDDGLRLIQQYYPQPRRNASPPSYYPPRRQIAGTPPPRTAQPTQAAPRQSFTLAPINPINKSGRRTWPADQYGDFGRWALIRNPAAAETELRRIATAKFGPVDLVPDEGTSRRRKDGPVPVLIVIPKSGVSSIPAGGSGRSIPTGRMPTPQMAPPANSTYPVNPRQQRTPGMLVNYEYDEVPFQI